METRQERSRPRLSTNDRIDVCRGLFAYLVVIAHALEVTLSMCPFPGARAGSMAEGLLVGSIGTGIYWVMGFFVISGYCIHLSVHRLNDQGPFPLRTYLIARLTRILPLYYLALLFTVLVEWWIAPARPANWPNGLDRATLAGQVLLVQNLTQTYGSFASSWSITNEAFYYVLYGVLVVACGRWERGPIAIGLAGSLGLGVILHAADRYWFHSPPLIAAALLFGLGAIWFLGAFVASDRERLLGDARVRALARAWPLVLAMGLALRCTYLVGTRFVLMASGLAFALMMIRFLGMDEEQQGGAPSRPLGPRARAIIEGLGLSSYPTYLFHGPILMLVGSVLIRLSLVPDWKWTWLILASSGIGSGIIGGYLVEAPIMSWRAAFLRRLRSSTDAGRIGGPVRRPVAATR